MANGKFRKFQRRLFWQLDWQLLFLLFAICLIGLGVIYSAGYDPKTGLSLAVWSQGYSMGLGFFVFFVSMFMGVRFWQKMAYPVYFVGCALLLVIMFTGVIAGGAQRWLDLGFIRMQPSELTKLGVILVLAKIFSSENAPRNGYTLSKLWLPCAVMLFPALLIAEQPDLGTAMCHILIGGSMLLLAGVRWKLLFSLSLVVLLFLFPAWKFLLEDYQRQRVLTFLAPESDPRGTGYHALQSKIAVGSGAILGKGFLQGTQTQLRFLPEQKTDFIFSVLAEEWGFVGSIVVLLLYALLILHLLNIASKCENRFATFVSFGVAAMLFWHVFINIGMVIGIVPVVGITLALLSYGGSSVVVIIASLGIVAGFSMRRFLFV